MPLADWFSARPRFHQLEDAFALDRRRLEAGLLQAIALQRQKCDEVWLVAHFFDTFVWLQDALGAADILYEIADQPLTIADVRAVTGGARVRLVLASLIEPPETPTRPATGWPKAAVMACERHPLLAEDDRLRSALRGFGASVVFGYMLSLDDPLIQPLLTGMVLDVMKQFGLDDQPMIASQFLGRQLTRKLIRECKNYASNEPADSAREWVKINQANQ